MKKHIIFIPILLIANILCANPEYSATYRLIAKSFTLNADGSSDIRFRKEIELFTTASMDTYGETFITYNTAFETLTINEAYTLRKDGSKVNTPERAFNPSLPYSCTDCERFNNIREMVVSHTALEPGAVIVLDYTLHSSNPFLAELMTQVDLYESVPIQRYTVDVHVPAQMFVNYLAHYPESIGQAHPSRHLSADSSTLQLHWVFENLPARAHVHYAVPTDIPHLQITTLESPGFLIDMMTAQNAFVNPTFNGYGNSLPSGDKTTLAHALDIRDYVADNIHTNSVSASLMNYIIASPQAVWSTNCGTPLEKDLLLYTILKNEGYDVQYGLVASTILKEPKSLLQITLGNRTFYTSANDKTRLSLAAKYGTDVLLLLNGNSITLHSQPHKVDVSALIQVKDDGETFSTTTQFVKNTVVSPDYNPMLSTPKTLAQTTITPASGNYFRVTIDDGRYGCDLNPQWLDLRRNSDLFTPGSIEYYHYQITLPEHCRWIEGNFRYEEDFDFGGILLSYSYEGNQLTIDRQLFIVTNVISKKQYKKFRKMIAQWATPRTAFFCTTKK